MKLRKLTALGMAAVMTMSLAACGSSNSTNTEAPAATTDTATDAAASTTAEAAADTEEAAVPTYASIKLGEDYTDLTASISFMHHKTDREEDGTMAKLIEEFNKVYPNITVTTEGITDYAETALLRLPTEDWGDIMFIPSVDAKDLSTYFYPFGTVDEMSELVNFADQWKADGLCYGVGYMGNAQGILYNKAVFEKAGITELPKTPDEFIADLQLIKDNTDAIPLYTNYAAGWTMGAWDAYIGNNATGDNTYMNQKLVHTKDPFQNYGDDTHAYAVYKILYDAVADGLIEDDFATTDWEGCKGMINNGEIGCMVLGSWAYPQMEAAGENGADIGYMPFPITVNGEQYASAGADYSYGINANATDDEKAAAMVFVKWMTEKSGFSYNEDGLPVAASSTDTKLSFDGVTFLEDEPALEGEEDFLNEMNAESELNINAGGDSKIQAIIEHASNGDKTFDEIMDEWNTAWSDAQESNGIEVTE